MHCYLEIDFNGPMRSDRVPALEGEDNFTPATTRVAAIGNWIHERLDGSWGKRKVKPISLYSLQLQK